VLGLLIVWTLITITSRHRDAGWRRRGRRRNQGRPYHGDRNISPAPNIWPRPINSCVR
jgi:hypothetical protein